MAPPDKDLEWSQDGLDGIYRQCARYWKIIHDLVGAAGEESYFNPAHGLTAEAKATVAAKLWRERHRVVGKVERDFNRYNFNTAIAALMELANAATAYLACHSAAERLADAANCRELAEAFTLLLAPLAPHLAEELWQAVLGHPRSVHIEPWPSFDAELARPEEIEYAVQLNGKLKARLAIAIDATEDEVREAAMQLVGAQLAGRLIKKSVVVPGRLVNFVI
jgi:leucyl-tRNA synthetase